MNWTEQEKELVRQLYPTQTAQVLAAKLGRTAKAVRQAASALKVKKVVHAPKNWRPIGSERMDRGIRIRKVSDTGNPKADWKRIDMIEWEAVHGPIPAGKFLMLKDSSKPRTLDNLALFTSMEHWARATATRLPPDIMKLVQLKGQITQAINRRLKTQQGPAP